MLVPHVVAWSMMFGAVLSWGIMWPLLAAREGDWYPAGLKSRDFQGLLCGGATGREREVGHDAQKTLKKQTNTRPVWLQGVDHRRAAHGRGPLHARQGDRSG